jgi:AAA domain
MIVRKKLFDLLSNLLKLLASMDPQVFCRSNYAYFSPYFPGTGKTHTLIEIIRQLTYTTPTNPRSQRLLVCGASNLSVDNILERLLSIPASDGNGKLKVTRVGHPARVMAHENVLDVTLEVKAQRTDEVFFFSSPIALG